MKVCSLAKDDFLWGDEGAGDASFGLLIIARVLNSGLFPADLGELQCSYLVNHAHGASGDTALPGSVGDE